MVAPFPLVRYLNFTPGPLANAKEGGLVRLAKGAAFPPHQHLGQEIACVLEGVLLLEGKPFHPGSIIESAPGSMHEFFAGPARDLVFIVAHNGVLF
jgi:quercetin dioxygenase-like cupin family protein